MSADRADQRVTDLPVQDGRYRRASGSCHDAHGNCGDEGSVGRCEVTVRVSGPAALPIQLPV
jgi:hypothetical protein